MKIEELKKIIQEEIENVIQEEASLEQVKEVMELIKMLGVSPHFEEIVQQYDNQLGLLNIFNISRDFHKASVFYIQSRALKIEPDAEDFEQNMNIFLQKLQKCIKSGSLKNVLSSQLNFPAATAVSITNSLSQFLQAINNKTNPGTPSTKKQPKKPWSDDDGVDSMLK